MKFEILKTVSDADKKRLQKKKVCDVMEIVMPSLYGYYKGWTGSTEGEYFSITFVRGVVTVSLEEREMCLTWRPVNYAIVDSLIDPLTPPVTDAKKTIVELYNKKFYLDDVTLVTFNDIMKALKWKFVNDKVTVQEHFLSEILTKSSK